MTEKSAADRVLELEKSFEWVDPEHYLYRGRLALNPDQCDELEKLAPALARQVKELEARCEQYEEDCDEIMAERDGHSDALLECSELLGGPEWMARIPPRLPPESGDLDRDVPVLISEMQAKVKALEANRCEHCGAKVSSYPNGCPGCGAPQCCQPCCDLQNARDRVKELEAEREYLHEAYSLMSSAIGLAKLKIKDNRSDDALSTLERYCKRLDELERPTKEPPK